MFTFPTPTDLLTSIGYWSDPIFQSWLPWVWVIVGFAVGSMLAAFLGHVIVSAVRHVFDAKMGHDEEIHPRYKIRSSTIVPERTHWLSE